jgi:hypothetical protein
MLRILRVPVFFLSVILPIQFAHADSLYTFTSANQTFTDQPLTLGFTFTANNAFTVSSLGWFDATGSGFLSPHTVAIFDGNGNLLASTTLSTGASDSLSGSFRYRSIAPITLQAANDYTLAGTTGGSLDPWTVNDYVTGLSINPAFTVGTNAARFAYGLGLVDPTDHFSDYRIYSGPNLAGTPVPEPASFLLLGLAAPLLFVVRRRRSHSL